MSAPVTPLKFSPKKAASFTRDVRTPGANAAKSPAKGKMRAVFCDVVVEDVVRTAEGWQYPPEIRNFLPCLGSSLSKRTASPAFPSTPSRAALDEAQVSHRPPDLERLRNLLLELESTEETYVRRLKVLYKLYASPLREFARNRDTEIIPLFDAKLMFGNIEAILPANEAFLHDLKASLHPPNGYRPPEHWANVMLRHLQYFSTLYPAYILNLESAKAGERDLRRRNTAFRNFIERTRTSAGEGHDNCSLESLLIEAAQRIPRYRLLLKAILKEVNPHDTARSAMMEAIDVASSIAALDENEDTRRAAALFGLGRAIDGFPPRITNSNRYFVDCIDVLDTRLPPSVAASAPGGGYGSHTDDLHCTLFLFNDRILIAKRNDADGTGRSIVGLDNINKLVQEMQGGDSNLSRSRSPMKSRGKSMRYRGDFDLGDIVANDLGELAFSLFLERPPSELTDRWNNRPLRQYEIIKPEKPEDKNRFLSNIWQCIVQNKTDKSGPKAMLLKQQNLSIYWNIYDKRSYLSEPRKAKMALQLSANDDFQELQLVGSAPCAAVSAILYDDGSCDYNLRIRGGNPPDPKYSNIAQPALVKHVLEAALHLRLYDTIPNVPGGQPVLDRQSSKASTSSRPLSASSNRPKSVLDFMLSPSSSVSSPRRTLSKASKTSTLDSHRTGSIFSGESVSTAQTSVKSHEAQESRPSPFRRPATSAGYNAPTSAPSYVRSHSEASKRSVSQSEKDSRPWYASQDSRSSRQLADAASLLPEAPAVQPEEAVEEIDQNILSRSRSDSSLYKSSSQQSLVRTRSGMLSRSTSTQSMRIDEENEEDVEEDENDEEEIIAPHTPSRCMSPNGALSPLQRSGTISRPQGPRQLGSRSPAPPTYPTMLSFTSRSRTPSPPLEDDNPFLSKEANSSMSKKRTYEDEDGDDSSTISKRALRAVTDSQSKSTKPASNELKHNDKSKTLQSEVRKVSDKSQAPRTALRREHHTDLQRNGSLPRSPHTRSLFQQSRITNGALPDDPSSSISKSTLPSGSRIPRKPVPPPDNTKPEHDTEMEIALVRRESVAERAKHAEEKIAMQTEIESLKKQLEEAQKQASDLRTKLDNVEATHTEEMEVFSDHTLSMANAKLNAYVTTTDARMAALEAENHRLRNERRALQALLKKQSMMA